MEENKGEILRGVSGIEEEITRQDLLSRISHEMRTPMNVIIGMTRMALQQEDAEKMKDYMRRVETSAWQLLDVLNDMLDVVRLQSGQFSLARESFSFNGAVQNALNRISAMLRSKKHRLQVDVAEDIPQQLCGDGARFTQVLVNLLSNAVKFTPEGGDIRLSGKLVAQDENRVQLELSVKDSGIGISEENLAKLFKSYEQLDGGMNRKFEGTGLGLVITKNIVELMDGELRVSSTLGEGSEFTFTVRMERGDESTAPRRSIPLSRHHILVADDNEETLLYLGNMLNSLNVRCDLAHGGKHAIDKAEEAFSLGDPYTVILMDWRMPDVDGIEAARQIRAKVGEEAAIIMLSMAEWSAIEADARAAGVDRFLSKPITISTLVDTLSEITDLGFTDSLRLGIDLGGKHILLGDDVEANRDVAAALLRRCGASVDLAANGAELVAAFSQSPEKYDLIVVDLDMPKLRGAEAVGQIRAQTTPQAKVVPIMALTAHRGEDDTEIIRARDAGINGLSAKPIDAQKFFEEVNRVISLKLKVPAAEATTLELPDMLPGLDVMDALTRLRNNRKLLSTLLDTFFAEDHVQQLYALIEEGDAQRAEQKAAALKVSAGNLGLVDIQRYAATIGLMIKNDEEKEQYISIFEQLKEAFARAKESAKIVAQSFT